MYKYIKLKHITIKAYLYISQFYNFVELPKTIKISLSSYNMILNAIKNN
jgi:hypothetical protein